MRACVCILCGCMRVFWTKRFEADTYLILCNVLEADEKKGFEGLEVLEEAIAEDLDEGGDGHEGVLLDAAGPGLGGRLEHLEKTRFVSMKVENKHWQSFLIFFSLIYKTR